MNQYRNATVRALIAAVIIAAWVIWYDGPPWAWALLAGYVAFTFLIAFFIQRQLDAKLSQKDRSE